MDVADLVFVGGTVLLGWLLAPVRRRDREVGRPAVRPTPRCLPPEQERA